MGAHHPGHQHHYARDYTYSLVRPVQALDKKVPGSSALLVTGGAKEAMYAHPHFSKLVGHISVLVQEMTWMDATMRACHKQLDDD